MQLKCVTDNFSERYLKAFTSHVNISSFIFSEKKSNKEIFKNIFGHELTSLFILLIFYTYNNNLFEEKVF